MKVDREAAKALQKKQYAGKTVTMESSVSVKRKQQTSGNILITSVEMTDKQVLCSVPALSERNRQVDEEYQDDPAQGSTKQEFS